MLPPPQVRKLISDFAIILTILLFCGVDAFVGVETPKLIVPSEFKVQRHARTADLPMAKKKKQKPKRVDLQEKPSLFHCVLEIIALKASAVV